MNLRKSRFNSGQERNSSCKAIKSSFEKKKLRRSENPKFSSGNLPRTPAKSNLNDIQISDPHLVTSTPIPYKIRKTISRTLNRCNSNEIAKLNSLKRVSCSITFSPIKKNSYKIKPCEVRLIPVIPRGRVQSVEKKRDQILRNNKKSSISHSSHFSLNSSTKALGRNVRSLRGSMNLQPQNIYKNMPGNADMSSRKLKTARKSSQKHLSKYQKSAKKLLVPQKEIKLLNNKDIKKSSTSKRTRSMADKSEISPAKKSFDAKISQKSTNSLLQSFHETDNAKSSRYNLRKSVLSVTEKKSYYKNNCPTYSKKLTLDFPCTPKNSDSVFKKSSRHSLRLQNQQLSTTPSSHRSTNTMSQDVSNTKNCVMKSNSNCAKRSRYSLSESHSSKETHTNSSLKHSLKKTTSAKKQKFAKNVKQNSTFEQCKKSAGTSKKRMLQKKSSSTSKKRMLQKKSTSKSQLNFLSFGGNIPIDDLALSSKSERRKVNSDGFTVSGKNTLKQKISAIEAVTAADEDYEDDLYESKKFDIFQELLMDTSDSEKSFAMSTPKFPVTPLIRHKTPKFKDCFSPREYAVSRKAALEYWHRRGKKRSQKQPETPVIVEKKKLDYSQALEDAQKLQEAIENRTEEESDNDSYFSFD